MTLVSVRAGVLIDRTFTAPFSRIVRRQRIRMTFPLFVEQSFNGLQLGLMLFLTSVGVTLVFGIMRVLNIAQGSMFMLGGYFMAAAHELTGSYWLSVPLALVLVMAVAAVMEIVILRPLYARGHLEQVLATFGASLLLNQLVIVIWGRDPLYLAIPDILSGSVKLFGGIPYPTYRLAITAVAAVVGLLLYLLIQHTRVGALIRAGSEKREMVSALGVNIATLYTIVFCLGSALAGLAGMMTGPLLSIESGMGDPVLILTLVVIVICGAGSIRGALVGSLLVGILDTFSRVLLPLALGVGTASALVGMMVYVLMALVLVYSRTGLFSAARG
jgi:branched-chain amino acid transport system permease protein